MGKTKLPVFKGQPLIEIPSFIPQIGFLEGDFGKAFLKEYQGRAKTDYKDSNVLNVLNYRDGVVKGSNPFAVVLANQILRQEGLRVATQADLEKSLKAGALNLRGTYEDTALVLRSEDNLNTYLATDLMNQVRTRNKKQNLPVMIPLTGLELKTDSNSPHGLTFKLPESAEIIYAPILNKSGNFNSEDIDEKTGLPKQTGEGNRTLYTGDSGLSRLYLLRVLDLSSYADYLASSLDDGRVVVVSAEGTSPENLTSELVSRINKEYQAQVDELNSRKAEAEKAVRQIMSGKK